MPDNVAEYLPVEPYCLPCALGFHADCLALTSDRWCECELCPWLLDPRAGVMSTA